jgi:putative spermidine/putrescine transport system permease protein
MGGVTNEELRAGLGVATRPLLAVGVVIGLFMLVPLVVIVPTSWSAGQLLEFPPQGFSLKWYREVLSDDTWLSPIRVSLWNSVRASVIATLAGTAAALGMRRLAGGRSVRVMRSLFILPLAIPYVSYALGMYHFVLRVPGDLRASSWPLVLTHATVTFPLVYVIVAGALAAVDPRLSNAASTLGARWPMIVWKVELPLIKMAIVGGWVFAFATAFDEATLAIFLSPIRQRTYAQHLFRETAETIDPTVSAISTLVTIAIMGVLGFGSFVLSRAAAAKGRPA